MAGMADQKRKGRPERMSVGIGPHKEALSAEAEARKVTQNQIIRNAIQTYLTLREHAPDGKITLLKEDGSRITLVIP